MYSQSFVLFALLFAVTAQECNVAPPRIHPDDCCSNANPRLISRTIAEECGLPSFMADGPPTGPLPSGPPPAAGPGEPGSRQIPCEQIQCILRKNNLLSTDNKIIKTALKTFLETTYSVDWKPVIDKLIQTCDSGTNIDATDDCGARRYINCIRKTAFLNCPASLAGSSPDCTQFKTFIQNCA